MIYFRKSLIHLKLYKTIYNKQQLQKEQIFAINIETQVYKL